MNAKEITKAINKLKRECRLASEGGRMKKAWRVPGTKEAGELAMLEALLRRASIEPHGARER
jgi:hypothetical protein